MKGTDGAIEALVVLCNGLAKSLGIGARQGTVDDALEGVLQLLMGLLKLVCLVCEAEGARVHEFQGDFDGYALVLCHKVPVLTDKLQHLFDGLAARPIVRVPGPGAILAVGRTALGWGAFVAVCAWSHAWAAVAGRKATTAVTPRPAITVAASPWFHVIFLGEASISTGSPWSFAFAARSRRIAV